MLRELLRFYREAPRDAEAAGDQALAAQRQLWRLQGGLAVLQAITIADAQFETYRSGADFSQRCIFPGGMLPCPSVLREQAARAGFEIDAVECFGPSYARSPNGGADPGQRFPTPRPPARWRRPRPGIAKLWAGSRHVGRVSFEAEPARDRCNSTRP